MLNFWARDSRFCIEVCMDYPNKVQCKKYKSTKYSLLGHFWAETSDLHGSSYGLSDQITKYKKYKKFKKSVISLCELVL